MFSRNFFPRNNDNHYYDYKAIDFDRDGIRARITISIWWNNVTIFFNILRPFCNEFFHFHFYIFRNIIFVFRFLAKIVQVSHIIFQSVNRQINIVLSRPHKVHEFILNTIQITGAKIIQCQLAQVNFCCVFKNISDIWIKNFLQKIFILFVFCFPFFKRCI